MILNSGLAHGRSKIMERAISAYTSTAIRRDIDGYMKVSAQTEEAD